MAEEAGFDALWISDHFHPWLDEQGQSSFVWSVIGAISQVTSLPVTTAVTCPTTRIHPAVIAQAAATAGLLIGGRFTLGVGTGEALNEHVTGAKWPPAAKRQEMLEEAVTIIAELFTGEQLTHHGRYYEVDARACTRPPRRPRRSTCLGSARTPPGLPRGSATGSFALPRRRTWSSRTATKAAATVQCRAGSRAAGLRRRTVRARRCTGSGHCLGQRRAPRTAVNHANLAGIPAP